MMKTISLGFLLLLSGFLDTHVARARAEYLDTMALNCLYTLGRNTLNEVLHVRRKLFLLYAAFRL